MKKKIVSCLLVAVMCTLIGSVAYADESGSMCRADNIKSHGTLLCEQADADEEVYITSQDMVYLAEEIDFLENIIDGLQCKDNPNVEYTYHYHHTGDGSVSSDTIYSYDNPKGCYENGGSHTHDAISSCPYDWVTVDCPYRGHGLAQCPSCGGGKGYNEETGESYDIHYPIDQKRYTCGSPTNTWTVQCGWREGAIEKAEIKFSPN